MKGRLIALDHIGEVEAAALMVDGKLEDLLIDSDMPRPGTIYRAIADRPMKGQGGMFLKTPDGNCFLRQTKGLAPGDAVLVQVTGYAEPGKAIPVTLDVLFKSRYAIITPDKPGLNISRAIRDDDRRDELQGIAKGTMQGSEFGLILRSACAEADDEDIAEDVTAMLDMANAVLADREGTDAEKLVEGDGPHLQAWREWHERATVDSEAGSFEGNGVLDAIEELSSAKVALEGGGFMYVEPTRALVAIDVNTGGDSSHAGLAPRQTLPRPVRSRVPCAFAALAARSFWTSPPCPRKSAGRLKPACVLPSRLTGSTLRCWDGRPLVTLNSSASASAGR